MKKIFYILFVLLVVSGAWVAWSAFTVYRAYTQPPSVQSTPVPSPTAEAQSRQTVHIGQALYTYDYIRVSTPSAVTVIPNFTEKKVVRALMNENSCTGAVNGGFYTKTDTPLGLFVTGGRKLGTQIESSLVNGFLWIDDSEYAVIASELPNLTPRLALQTGPLLMFNRQPLALNIHNDTGARRMTAAKTKDGSLLFLTVYDAESVFNGPLLTDMPDILSKISSIESLDLTDAINLDGGSASSFYGGDTKLTELTPVGSVLCIREVSGR